MSKSILLLAASLTISACVQPDTALPPGAGESARPAASVEIRVANATNIDFDRVVVQFPKQTEQYGAVDAKKASDYRRVDGAYRYAYVEARSGEKRYVVQPFDFVGESFLRAGRYTYSLEGHFSDEPSAGASNSVDGFMRLALKVDRRAVNR